MNAQFRLLISKDVEKAYEACWDAICEIDEAYEETWTQSQREGAAKGLAKKADKLAKLVRKAEKKVHHIADISVEPWEFDPKKVADILGKSRFNSVVFVSTFDEFKLFIGTEKNTLKKLKTLEQWIKGLRNKI